MIRLVFPVAALLLCVACAATPSTQEAEADEPTAGGEQAANERPQLPPVHSADGPGWRIRDQVFTGAISGIRARPTSGWQFAPPLLESRPGAELAMLDAAGEAAIVLMSEHAPGLTQEAATAELVAQLGEDNQQGTIPAQLFGEPFAFLRFEAGGSHLAIGTLCRNDTCVTLSITSASSQTLRRAAESLPELEWIDEAERAALQAALLAENRFPERVYRHAAFRAGTLIVYPLGFTLTVPPGLWRVEDTPGSPAMVELTELITGAHFALGIAPLEDAPAEEAHEELLMMVGLGNAPIEERTIAGVTAMTSTEEGLGQAGSIARETDENGEFLVWWYARARPSLEVSAAPVFEALENSIVLSDPIEPIGVEEGRFFDRRLGVQFALPEGTELRGAPEPPPGTGLYLFEGEGGRTQVAVSQGSNLRIQATLDELARRENGAREDGAVPFAGQEGSAPGLALHLDGRLVQIQGESPEVMNAIASRMETLPRP